MLVFSNVEIIPYWSDCIAHVHVHACLLGLTTQMSAFKHIHEDCPCIL